MSSPTSLITKLAQFRGQTKSKRPTVTPCNRSHGRLRLSDVILVDDVPVFFESSQRVTHSMGILNHNKRSRMNVALVKLPILFQLLVAGIHGTINVGIRVLNK